MSNSEKLRNIDLKTGMQDGLELEVAVVGAGTSGLYTAYRLAVDDGWPEGSVQIFEGSDRISGRLDSVVLPGLQITGELGGMRYLRSQEIVTTLIEEVFKDDLTTAEFPMGDPANLFCYLRKQRLRMDAWTNAQQPGSPGPQLTNYQLNPEDVGFSADQLFNKVVYDILVADPWFRKYFGTKISQTDKYTYNFTLTAQDWDEIKPNLTYCLPGPYEGTKVNDLGFWNVIKDRVSEEGFDFLDEAGGYYSNTINWNAAEALPYMVGDFSSADVTYRTIEGGYDLISYALAYHYLQTPGAAIWTENKLLRFEPSDGGPKRYRLTFENQKTKTRWTVYANRIVLAMPRRSLELLDQDAPFFQNETLQRNIPSVIMEPSFKILMGFENAWWTEDFGATSGHSITDLPLRQCYYFGTDKDDTHSLLLGSYNDMRTVTFWIPLNDHPERFVPRPTSLVSHEDLAKQPHGNVASKRMVDEVLRQLQELHGPDMKIPEPFVAWYKDWTDDPYGGGYHAWKAVFPVHRVMPYMRRPDPDESVFICGEAYSDQQGWAEGAFCVAERMLQDHFELDWPHWLDPRYYLGW